MFDRAFMEYHADRFSDASQMLFEAEELVGLIPANRSGATIYSHQGLTFGGLVIDTARATEILAMLDAAASAWRERGGVDLVYKPTPWIYHRRPAQEDLYWLFRRGAVLERRDLTASLRYADRGALSKRRQRGAQKAVKAGLTFPSAPRLGAYWDLLTGVLEERHGTKPVHTLREIESLAAAFPENIVLHVAEDAGGEVLAGVLLFVTSQVAHAQYIAASQAGRDMGALDGLFLRVIDHYAQSHAFFDFGISNEDQGRVLNEGLMRQKEEFGASGAAHDFYRVTL